MRLRVGDPDAVPCKSRADGGWTFEKLADVPGGAVGVRKRLVRGNRHHLVLRRMGAENRSHARVTIRKPYLILIRISRSRVAMAMTPPMTGTVFPRLMTPCSPNFVKSLKPIFWLMATSASLGIFIIAASFSREKEVYNEDFLKAAEILYFSDGTRTEDPYEFIKEMAQKYGTQIILLGQSSEGVILYDRRRDINVHYDPVSAGQVVNTAGAGNAQFACFLHYYLKNGDSKEAMHKALLFTANKIGYMGTSNGFMTEEQLEQWESLIFDPNDVVSKFGAK